MIELRFILSLWQAMIESAFGTALMKILAVTLPCKIEANAEKQLRAKRETDNTRQYTSHSKPQRADERNRDRKTPAGMVPLP